MTEPGARLRSLAVAAAVALTAAACASGPSHGHGRVRRLEVTATAYNSVRSQTSSQPTVGAWGDVLRPGMKAIAVSRDLIALGLGHGARVEIEGLDGVYVVRDKMAKRWRQEIDIYMGNDVEAARAWGRRRVHIRWTQPAP